MNEWQKDPRIPDEVISISIPPSGGYLRATFKRNSVILATELVSFAKTEKEIK